MRIAVKYCGGCNPGIERGDLVFRLADILAIERPEWELVLMNDEPWDVLLIINGCPVGCSAKQFLAETRPVLIVAGESLQHKRMREEELPMAVFQKVMEYEVLRKNLEKLQGGRI